jgi:tetratricopeptide (TPR) repeat protein
MKNTFCLLLLFCTTVWSQSAFDKGNKAYQKGNYEAAIEQYNYILKSKKQSAELYFNLGNCYYKLNKVAPAIYNFEKALLLSPDDTEIQNNLRFAHKLLIDDIKEEPKVGFNKWVSDIVATHDYNAWAWISVSLSVLFLLSFIGYYFSGTSLLKRIFFIAMFLCFIGILLSALSSIFGKKQSESDRPAIVFEEIMPVKTEPKADANDAFLLHEGTKVFIKDTLDNWRKIEILDGKSGWVNANAIQEIK